MGEETANGYFYKLDYDEEGPESVVRVNAALDRADAAIASFAGESGLPPQSGHEGEFLKTDGSSLQWATPVGSGNMVGPESAVDSNLVAFNTGTGKLAKDSGYKIADLALTGHTHSGTYEPANANIQSHVSSTANPHSVTKAQVGLGSVPNLDCADPDNITQDYNHQFVTTAERTTWNGKQDALPDVSGQSGRVLGTNGSELSWVDQVSNFTWQNAVLAVQAAPPDTPSDGDRYIVATGTGDWADHDNDIAQWDGIGEVWDFTTPSLGWVTVNVADGFQYLFNGAGWTGDAGQYVPRTTTVNGHALTGNISVTKSDVGLGSVPDADATNPANITQDSTHRFATDAEKAAWNAAVPNTRTVNGHALSADVTVSKTDVGLGNVTNDVQIPKSLGTAKGDIIGFSASGVPERLPAGTNAYVLTADSAQGLGMKWAVAPGAAGGTDNYLELQNKPRVCVGDTGYGTTIQEALATIGSNVCTLEIPRGNWAWPSSPTVLSYPANVTLEFAAGAVIDYSTIPHGSITTIAATDINDSPSSTKIKVTCNAAHGVSANTWVRPYDIQQSSWVNANGVLRCTAVTTTALELACATSSPGAYTEANGKWTLVHQCKGMISAPRAKIFDMPSPCLTFGTMSTGTYYCERSLQPIVCPEWFGAVGDWTWTAGSYTDDYTALMHCVRAVNFQVTTLTASGQQSSPKVFLSRFYYTTKTISIFGQGNYGQVTVFGIGKQSCGIVGCTPDYPVMEILSSVQVTLTDFLINGISSGSNYCSCGLLIGRASYDRSTEGACEVDIDFRGVFLYGALVNSNMEVNRLNTHIRAIGRNFSDTINAYADTGATVLQMASTANLKLYDYITVILNDLSRHWSSITNIDVNGINFTIADALPSPADSGKAITTTHWKAPVLVGKVTDRCPGLQGYTCALSTNVSDSALQNYFEWLVCDYPSTTYYPGLHSSVWMCGAQVEVDKYYFNTNNGYTLTKGAHFRMINQCDLLITGIGVIESDSHGYFIAASGDAPGNYINLNFNPNTIGTNYSSLLSLDSNTRAQGNFMVQHTWMGGGTKTIEKSQVTYITDSATNFSCPTGNLYSWMMTQTPPIIATITKAAAGAVTINPGTGNTIVGGSSGQVYQNTTSEVWSHVQLQLVGSNSSVNTWLILNKSGTWAFA